MRTLGRVEHPDDFSRIIVANVGGRPIRVSDIGYVVDGYEEPRSEARLDGRPAVLLEVRKQAGTNTLEVIKALKDRIAVLRQSLPPDLEITFTRDQSGFISESFHAVQEHLVLGGIFASVIVFLFLRDWRSTLIAAIAIPTSIISTYTLMAYMGFTLNQMTMLALVLMVGIVIDDAIVVLENIYRNAEEKGLTPYQARHFGHQRDWSGRDGYHPQSRHHLHSSRNDAGHCRQVYVELRLHRRIRHHGFLAGQLHVDAHALLPLPAHQEARRNQGLDDVPCGRPAL